MLVINNESTLKDVSVIEEVNNTFRLLPEEVLKLAKINNLYIHYVEKTIVTVNRLNGMMVSMNDTYESAGLFDTQNQKIGYDIYVSVLNNDSAYKRVETLMHELGHFIDFIIGKAFCPANDGFHFYSFNNGYWDEYHDKVCEVINDELEGDTSYWTMQIIEQFAEYFALRNLGRVRKYENDFQLYDKHVEQAMTLLIRQHESIERKKQLKNKLELVLTKIRNLFKKEKQVFAFKKQK